MHIVFTGGGTGGHILPGIAVIRALRSYHSQNVEISWIGGRHSIEEKICTKEDVPFFGIQTGKWRRYFDVQNFIDIFKVPVGFFQAFKILRKLRPNVVFAKGGYISFPVGMAAAALGIPLVLHESDATPGMATKMLSKFAKKIFLGFEPASYFFMKQKKDTEVVGTPVREEILDGSKEKGRTITGFSSHDPVLFVAGGSLGAASLNTLLWESLPELETFCQIIHVTGKGKGNDAFSKSKRYFVQEYSEESLPHLYALTDLFISRAGASMLSEIIALRRPHILFPLGTDASRGDQWANAKFFNEQFGTKAYSDISKKEFIEIVKRAVQEKNLKKAQHAIPKEVSQQFKICASVVAQSLLNI